MASPPVALPGIRGTFRGGFRMPEKSGNQNTPHYSLKEFFFNGGEPVVAARRNTAIRLVDIAISFIMKSGQMKLVMVRRG
jgi:hypothetical protein